MLGRLPAYLHFCRVAIQTSLHRDQHVLVLPARYAPLRSWRAACFERTSAAFGGPVTVQSEPTFDRRHMLDQTLVCRTPILVQSWHVAEGFSVKPPGKSSGGGQGLWHQRHDAGLVAGEDLLAFIVAAISHCRQILGTHRFARFLGHVV